MNDRPFIQDALIADIEKRRALGIERYGTALQPFNGRDALVDAYEESLDLATYLKQVLVERGEEITSLSFEQYQDEAATTAVYSHQGELGGLAYCALGLAGEAGELANKIKKILRGDRPGVDKRHLIADEIGDVLWYAAQLATEMGLELEEIARGNLNKLAQRAEAGTLKGTGEGVRDVCPKEGCDNPRGAGLVRCEEHRFDA